MTKLRDLSGLKFGRLTVIERYQEKDKKGVHWLCKCECGTETIVMGKSLKNGKTKSCGCYRHEKNVKNL